MDINKAFEAENGFIVNTGDGNGPFITGGIASPVGLDLDTRTIYIQTNASSKILIWQKFGAGVNDWRQLSAEDILFDVSSLTSDSPDLTGLTETQETVEALANRHFGKDFAQETRTDSQAVTGSTFTVRDTVNFTATGGGTNTYRVHAYWTYAHNSASNDARFQIFVDGGQVGQEVREEPKDAGSDQRFGRTAVFYVSNLSDGAHTFDLRFRPSTASRVTTVQYSVLEVWRVA